MMTKKQADRLIDSGELVVLVTSTGAQIPCVVVLYYRGVITTVSSLMSAKVDLADIIEWHELRHTFAEAKERLARVGVTIVKTEWDDYRVNVKGYGETTASYTDDLEDAIGTGFAMAKWKEGK